MCPIHLHFLFFISFTIDSCLVIFQSIVLDILSVHFRHRILRRHLLMKVCILFSMFCVSCINPGKLTDLQDVLLTDS